jgi:hypothetical protein
LIDEYLPFTCVSDFVKRIPKYDFGNHLNRFDQISNKSAIFLQKAMLTAINRKVKNMAVLKLKRQNPKIMDQIKQ